MNVVTMTLRPVTVTEKIWTLSPYLFYGGILLACFGSPYPFKVKCYTSQYKVGFNDHFIL